MQQVMTKTATTTETMKIKTNFLSLSIKCLAKKKCSIFAQTKKRLTKARAGEREREKWKKIGEKWLAITKS